MRKVMKNLFVFTLVLAIIVSNSMTAFATENTGKNPEMVTCAELGCIEEVHLEGCEFYVEPKDTQEEVDEEDKEADGTEETTTPAPETDANNGVAAVSEDGEDVAYVAKIGETSYETFEAALTAASDMTGDVTVEIYDKVTLNSSLSGSYNSIKFAGKNSDAEIYLEVQGYITASGKKVAFEELILSKSAGGFIGNAGFMNVAFGVYDVSEVTYTDCTFENGAYASAGEVTFTGCTFKHSHDKYGLWAYGNVDVKVDGCTFADYRGIKMYAEGAAKTVDLTVENTDFTAVTDKPAIVLTYGESVTLANNTYSSTGTFELDLDGAPNGTAVTSDVAPTCKNDNGACGVLVDGKIYTTVAQAAEAATSGSTVTLLHESTETVEFTEGVTLDKNGFTADNVTVDNETPAEYVAEIGDDKYETLQAAIDAAQTTGGDVTITLLDNVTENVTIDEKVGHYLTIDGADKTVNGKITINPLSDTNDNRKITIQNIKFVNTADTGVDFITANQTNHYPRLSVLNCDFTGNGKDTDVAIRTKSAYDLIIKDCTGTGLHSFLQNTAGVKVTVRNVTVTDSKGGLAMGTAQNVEVRGCNLTTDTYGIRLDAVLDTSATLNGNVVNAYIPVSVRKATAAEYKLTLSGSASSYTATNTDGKWMAICGTEYEENVALNPATGNVKLTWNTDVLDESGVYGAYEWPIEVVYSDGYTRGFDSLASAMSHGYSGSDEKTITVLSDVTLSDTITISDKQVLDLNGKTLNGNIVVAESGDVTIKNGSIDNKDSEVSAIETVGTLTLEDVDITSARHAVRVEGGTTTINSGRYKVYGTAGMTTHALNAGGGSSEAKVIINGGVFVGPADTEADSGAAINVQNMVTVEIKDGAFIGGKNQTLASAGTLTVYGGCFDQEVPAEYLAEGKACVKGTYTYEGDAYPYAVKAFPSAGDGSGSSDKNSADKDDSKEPVEVHYAKTAAQTTSAKTGDASNAMLWICIMGVALITVVTVFAIRKKSEK